MPPERPALGTALAARQPLADVYEQAALVESLGYGTIWLPEIAGRDAFVACALLSTRVERIELATGIVPIGVRGPALTAMAAATVAEAAPGRFRLGVGIGHAETTGPWFGAGPPPDLAETEARLRLLKALLRGERAPDGGRLRGAHHASPPPIALAALSEGLVRLAGREADGVLFNWITAPRAAELVATLRAEAEAHGRDPGTLRVAAYVPVTVTDDTAAAAAQLARQIAAYGRLRSYRRSLERCGLGAAATRLSQLGPDDHGQVPEELIEGLGAIGPVAAVRARIEEFHAAGVDQVVLAPVPLPGELGWPSMVETWSALAG
jgi:5,10-methylenetetrahydromethanopterin reductase